MEDICMLLEGSATEEQYTQLLHLVQEQLASTKGNFSTVLKTLSADVEKVDPNKAAECILGCLLWCSRPPPPAAGSTSPAPPPLAAPQAAPVVQHLLIEALPQGTGLSDNRQLATELMLLYCSSGGSKLASKVASSFHLTREDLGSDGWQQLSAALPLMLQQPTSYKPAVYLMMQFEGLDEVVDRVEVLTQLVADGQDTLAQQWATLLGKDYQISFVEACVALDRLKPAARAVRQLQLGAEFPNVEAMYRQRSLSQLLTKRLWSVALSYAGNDGSLQRQLVQGMSELGEHALAEEFRKQLALPPDTLAPPDPAVIAAQEAARRAAYLQLELPSASHLLWVDDAAGCSSAYQALSGSDVLGLDVEWKPSHVAGVASPAAVLQVASRTHVVLFDLMTLCQHHSQALDSCLGPLLGDGAVLKLGFEVAGDIAKLAGSWPAVGCFRQVVGVLDLRPLFVAYGLASQHPGRSARTLSAVGLSTLCQELLGKPLDKSQQMSDWQSRPLTDRQKTYAALDAYVLPKCFDVLKQQLGPEATQQLVQQHTKTLSRPQQPSGTNSQPSSPRASTAAAAVVAPTTAAQPSAATPLALGGSASTLTTVADAVARSRPAGEQQVLALLQQHGLQDRFKRLHVLAATGSAHTTAWETAAAAGVPIHQVAKTMTLLVDQQPRLVVTRGDQRIDMHKLAALLGVKRRSIAIAPETTVARLTGFTSGVPPVGYDGKLPVIVDQRLAAAPTPAQPTAAVAAQLQASSPATTPAAVAAAAGQPDAVGSMPVAAGRGSLGLVAAAAVLPCQDQLPNTVPPPVPTSQPPQHDSTVSLCDITAAAAEASANNATSSAAITSSRGTSSNSSVMPSLLAVQCGPGAVLQLSFEELLAVSGGAAVADVADAPAESAGLSTLTGAATPDSTNPSPQGPPKFLLDSMLGRLTRWLRALGIDAEFVEPGQQGQPHQQATLIQQVQEAALLQGRLFVTRDQKLASRRDVGGSVYLLSSNESADQLAELSKHFGIKLDESQLMSRCSVCNAAAFRRITHEQAAAHPEVTERLRSLVTEFWECGKCGKCVWMGPKSYAAINLLEGLFTEGKSRPTPLQSTRGREHGDDPI